MNDVKCKACGKHYNYRECGCCPNCGAYNRPPRKQRVTADGDVYHVNESAGQETQSGSGKVCFEKKDCYEEQAHPSSVYTQPSAYDDGYLDLEDEYTDEEEAMDQRFEAAASASEARFAAAADRFDGTGEPVEHHSGHKKTVEFDFSGAAQKLEDTISGLSDSLHRKKGYTERTGRERKRHGVAGAVVKVVVVLVAINIIAGLLGTLIHFVSDGGLEDLLISEENTAPAIPEEYAEIYEHMEWLGESENLGGNERVYSVPIGQDFVVGGHVGVVEDWNLESGEDIYGWGQLVTFRITWQDGELIEPVLYSQEGWSSWNANYYWDLEKDGKSRIYQFLVDDEETVPLRLVFENYPEEEVQIILQ